MSVKISKADLTWLKKFLVNYGDLVEEYPELFKTSELDDYKVALQLVKEKLNETSNR